MQVSLGNATLQKKGFLFSKHHRINTADGFCGRFHSENAMENFVKGLVQGEEGVMEADETIAAIPRN